MVLMDCFSLLAIRKKSGKRKIIAEENYLSEMPDEEFITRFIEEHKADSAVVIKEYELTELPFE